MVSVNASMHCLFKKQWKKCEMFDDKRKRIPVRGTIYSNQLPQLSMQMSTNANTNVECNGKLTKYKHFFCRFVQFHIFSFLADSQHIYCPFVQFSTFNIFFGRFSTHLSPSFTWSLLVLVRAVHHLTQTSTSIFANSSLGLVPHSLGVTSSHQRPSILGSKYVTIKKNRSWLEWIPPLWPPPLLT